MSLFKNLSAEINQQINSGVISAYKRVEKNRIDNAYKLRCFYDRNLKDIQTYMIVAMLSSAMETLTVKTDKGEIRTIDLGEFGVFSTDSVKVIPKVHYNFIHKVLRNICTSYNIGIDRYLTDVTTDKVNEDETDKMMELYKGIDRDFKKIHKMGKFFGCIAVEPYWDMQDKKIRLNVYTPDVLKIETRKNNYLIADKIKIRKERINKEGVVEEYYVVWTDEEHYLEVWKDGKWNKEAVTITNEEGNEISNGGFENPYERNPVKILRFDEDTTSFFPEGMLDLVEQNIWHNIRENSDVIIEIFQGLGIILGVNLGKDSKISINPFTILNVNQKNIEHKPDIKSISTNAPLEELRENLNRNTKMMGMLQGIGVDQFESRSTAGKQTAESKSYDFEEISLIRQDDEEMLIMFEEDLNYSLIEIYNLNIEDSTKEIDLEKFVFKAEFIKKTEINVTDNIANWQFQISIGAKTVIDYIISLNPSLNTKQAEQILKDNIAVKRKMQELFGATALDDNSENRTNQNNNSNQKGINENGGTENTDEE